MNRSFCFHANPPLQAQLFRAGYLSCDRAGSGYRGTGKVYFRIHMSHASHKVAVCGGHGLFSRSQYSHVSSQARPAGWRADHRSGFYEGGYKALLKSFQVYILVAGNMITRTPLATFLPSKTLAAALKSLSLPLCRNQ